MKTFFLIIILCFYSTYSFCQIKTPKKAIETPANKNEVRKDTPAEKESMATEEETKTWIRKKFINYVINTNATNNKYSNFSFSIEDCYFIIKCNFNGWPIIDKLPLTETYDIIVSNGVNGSFFTARDGKFIIELFFPEVSL